METTEDDDSTGDEDLYYGRNKPVAIIPNRERKQPGNSSDTRVSQGKERGERRVPPLCGKTMEEVRSNASRIKLGSVFSSFGEFDRCLDSFCVLQGRGAARYSTKRTHVVRVCRFGPTVRTHLRKSVSDNPMVSVSINPSSCPIDQQAHFPQHLSECDDRGHWLSQRESMTGKENSEPGPKLAAIPDSSQHRPPLSTLKMNGMGNIHHAQQMLSQSDLLRGSAKASRTRVKNTKAWLPPPDSKKTGRKVGPSGACGELSRFLDDDGPHDRLSDPRHLCPFRVRAQQHSTGLIEITLCNLRHSCPQNKHKWRGPTHKSAWLGETLAPRVVRNVKVPVKEMLAGFQMDYKKSSTYHQMWRAVDHVRDWYMGGQRNSFHLIPGLLRRIQEVDDQAVVDFSTVGPENTFERAFVCPGACRLALNYCQPLVSLDACHTKNRKYPTQLFLATALDGNSRLVILCWALAPVENKANWVWFLEHLKFSIERVQAICVPLISDRQKGLIPAVRTVFPDSVHGHCANHLRANVKKLFGEGASQYFTRLVYADTKKEFEDILTSMSKTLQQGDAAVRYIRQIDPACYARYAFPLPRMGQVTSNPGEVANNGLLPIRAYAPFKVLVEMWLYVQQKFVAHGQEVQKWETTYTPKATRRLEENQRTFGQWQVYPDGAMEARVQMPDSSDMHLVTISEDDGALSFTCTCRELQDMCWPCEHIMAWDDQAGRDYTVHFRGFWKTSILRLLYAPTIPCFLDNDLQSSDTCSPPEVAVRKGRHRVVRMRSGKGKQLKDLAEDEFFDSSGNLSVRYPIDDDPNNIILMPTSKRGSKISKGSQKKDSTRGKSRCSCCGGLGHNKRTCKTRLQQPAADVQEEIPAAVDASNEGRVGIDVVEDSQFVHVEELYDSDFPEDNEYGYFTDGIIEDNSLLPADVIASSDWMNCSFDLNEVPQRSSNEGVCEFTNT